MRVVYYKTLLNDKEKEAYDKIIPEAQKALEDKLEEEKAKIETAKEALKEATYNGVFLSNLSLILGSALPSSTKYLTISR